MDEFINSQKNVLGISDFLKSAQNYTKENFPDINLDTIFNNAISGNIDNHFWTSNIFKLARTRSKDNSSTNDYSIDCNYYS